MATKTDDSAVEVKLAYAASASPAATLPLPWLVWTVMVLAAGLRLAQYLFDRSLWLDEANLALNLIHRSYSGLLRPLDYHQGAPLGFLLAEKWFVRTLGAGEYALRLLPLLAGIASVFLFYVVARRALRPAAVVTACGLFALSAPLIYYSSEVKQYSSDVAIAILIYALVFAGRADTWSGRRLAGLALVGAVAIWCSHASVFVLGGIGGSALLCFAWRLQWRPFFRLALPCLVWAISLGVFYLVSLRHLTADRALLDYWRGNFMPFPPRSAGDVKWFVDSFFNLFSQAAGLQMVGLAAFAFLVGTIHMYARDREKLFFLLAPLVLTLVASGLGKYPFGGRLALFAVPALLMLIAEGAEQVRTIPRRYAAGAAYILIFLLFLDPVLYAARHFLEPHKLTVTSGTPLTEEIKPAIRYLWAHEKPGDLIYVITGAQPAYRYYEELYGRKENNLVLGTAMDDDARSYAQDLGRLRGHRAWIVLAHISGDGATQAQHILFYLDLSGTRLDRFATPGAELDLYDVRPGTSSVGALDEHR